jgi:hypothetical protein
MWKINASRLSWWPQFTIWPLPGTIDWTTPRWACIITIDPEHWSSKGSVKWRKENRDAPGEWVESEMPIDDELATFLQLLLEGSPAEPFFDYLTERGFLPLLDLV